VSGSTPEVAGAGEAARLRDRLAELAAEQATLEAELAAFHADWLRQVGTVMARVDELQARVLALVAERSHAPGDVRAAEAAEDRARRTTAEARAVPPPAGPPPTADLKRLFRDAAKRMHPDLAGDDAEASTHAEAFMKRLNDAYRAGDAEAIRDLLGQWDSSPYAPAGPGPGPVAPPLGRLRAAVARAERRIAELRASQLAELMERAMAASTTGGDLLTRMRADADAALAAAQARLAELQG
jgi:hypothetical protein